MTANRILIQEEVFDAVVKRLAEAMDRELRVGSGLEPTNTQGPLINARQLKRVSPCGTCYEDEKLLIIWFVGSWKTS